MGRPPHRAGTAADTEVVALSLQTRVSAAISFVIWLAVFCLCCVHVGVYMYECVCTMKVCMHWCGCVYICLCLRVCVQLYVLCGYASVYMFVYVCLC